MTVAFPRRIRFFAGAFLCALLLENFGADVARASINERIHAQKTHIQQTKQNLRDKRQELGQVQERERQLREALAQTQTSISDASSRLNQLQGKISENERQQAWNRIQLQAAKDTLERHNAALRRRLVDAYENGSMGYLEVLLTAHSFSEFVERWDDIRLLVAANERTIRERRAAEHEVIAVQTTLQNEGNVLDEQHSHALLVREQLRSLEEQRRNLIVVTDRTRRQTTVAVSELEESSQAQENQLQSMIVEREREVEAALAAARAAAREAARRAAQLAGSTMPKEASPGAPGDFSWPVSGPITSPFGMRLDPVSGEFTRMHTGIDIGAPQGATIVAAAPGRVIIAGWTDGGYGNMVVIAHGDGLSTVYAHCSQVFVANGQDVQRGQAIAAVGTTGHSTGPHLHFEVRVGGQPVDPTNRLR